MITIENVTIYKCVYCGKELKRKSAMTKHEDLCFGNPKNRKACHFCKHLKEVKINVVFEYSDGMYREDIEKSVKSFKCEMLNKLMFPYSIERKGLHKKYETFSEQEPMPNECEHYQEEQYNL